MGQLQKTFDEGGRFLRREAEFRVLAGHIDLAQHVHDEIMLCTLLFDLQCQGFVINGMDEFRHTRQIFHLVRLQVPDHVPVERLGDLCGLIPHFLDFILAENTAAGSHGFADIRYGLGLTDGDERHLRTVTACSFAGGLDPCIYFFES